MTLIFHRSYISLWNYWLLLTIGLVCLLTPSLVTDLANRYLPLDDLLATVDAGVRTTGLILTGWMGGWIMIKRLYSRYTVYEDRLEARHGILRRRTSTASFSHIRSIDIDKSLPGMLLGYGDLLFGTAGTGETNVVFHGIADPEIIKEKIRRLQTPGVSPASGSPADQQTAPHASPDLASAPAPQPSRPDPSAPQASPAPTHVEEPPASAALNVGINHSERPGSNPLPYDAEGLNQELDRRIQSVMPVSRD
jgi:membrane protein YdbS with pleckstrin-like domain